MAEPKENEDVGVSRSKSEEIITFNATAAGLGERHPTKSRVVSADNRNSSPLRKFTLRQSMDSRSYEIVGPDKLEDQNLEASLHQQTPIVKLNRLSPTKTSALEPHEIALISSSVSMPEETTTTYNNTPIMTTTTSEEVAVTPKPLNREMKNLQQSANSSKVLSNFLTNTDTPRRRKNKERSMPPADVESELDLSAMETESYASFELMDKEIPLKHSPISNNESDSTIVLQDENVPKRRKSVPRPRSRSRSRNRGRPKSIAKLMNDELAVESEKEENDENFEDTHFVQPFTFENRAPNPPPKPGWDSYCFKCHLDNAVLSLACSKCKCSYHRACVRPNPIPKNADEFVCPECREIQMAEESELNKFGHPKIDQSMMKDMLSTILETIRTQTGRDYFEEDIPFKQGKDTNPLIVKQMSYKKIEERITNFQYKTTEAFVHDMKQLEHNWTLVDKSKAKALKTVLKYVIGDTNEMESCIHCYSSAFVVKDWFASACKRPHLLVWAKLKGYPFWPAKVMSVDPEKQLADVRFFGAHDRAYLPSQQCLIYCEKDPNKGGKGTPTNNKKGIGDAVKETEEYIRNVSEIYGFEYSTSREFLDTKNFQAQLEKQLPKFKSSAITDKEVDAPQKEKLTLKFIRTSDVNKNAEKASNVTEKERHPLYRVLSKTDTTEMGDTLQKTPKILSRRNTHDSEKSSKSTKKSRTSERIASETSESNLSTTESQKSSSVKRMPRGPYKRRRKQEATNTEVVEPDPKRFCPPPVEDSEEQLLEEIPTPKPVKRQRNRSRSVLKNDDEGPLVVTVGKSKIPAFTDEIQTLRISPTTTEVPRAKHRSRSFQRSQSQEKDPSKKKVRRSSAHPASRSIEETEELLRPEVSILRRSLSSTASKGNSSHHRSTDTPSARSIHDFPSIEIKSEPTSDIEEIIETTQVTVDDIADLVSNTASKQKTIIISTSCDNSNDSFQASRKSARKSFPNSVSSRPSSRENSLNPMVCIPQIFPPINSTTQQSTAPVQNVNGQLTSAPASPKQNRVNASSEVSENMPRLIPKPAGVFTQDGNNFQLESDPVSSLFAENAHRMTDYFKSLLVDTIGAVSSGIPTAEITLLRLENEKLKLHAQKTKNDHTLTIERMKKEHMDEIKLLRFAYEDKLKKHEENAKQDMIKAKAEIRHVCEIDKQQAIDALKKEYKKTTWCSCCLKEARYYCCWNTSYCGPVCQREHWSTHQNNCRNTNTNNSNSSTNTSARSSPSNSKRTTAPSVPSSTVPTSSVSSAYQNATMVTPIARKVSINAVQSISTPISTPVQIEIRPSFAQQPQIQQIPQPQIIMSNNTIHRYYTAANMPSNISAYLQQQQPQIRPVSQNPPALLSTTQGKKTVVQKIVPQPNLIVIPRTHSPPINIISTATVNPATSVAVQNMLSAAIATNAINNNNLSVPKNSVATIVPIASNPNNNN